MKQHDEGASIQRLTDWLDELGLDAEVAEQAGRLGWLGDEIEFTVTRIGTYRDQALGWHYEAELPRDPRDVEVGYAVHRVFEGSILGDGDLPDGAALMSELLESRGGVVRRLRRIRFEHTERHRITTV